MQNNIVVGFLFGVVCVSACSSSHSAGEECSSNSDCSGGLSCVTLGTFSDAGCSSGPKACSKTCQSLSDCSSLGANYMCFAACDGTSVCGQTP
jgi:hypothetical protein